MQRDPAQRPRAALARLTAMALCLALGITLAATAQDGTKKLDPPSKADQDKAEIEINRLLGESIKKAKTDPVALQSLATDLLKDAIDTKEDEGLRFVGLKMASELAAAAGDTETAMKAIAELDKIYKVNVLTMKSSVLIRAAQRAESKEASQGIAEAALALLDEALAEDNFDAADQLIKVAQEASTKVKSLPLAGRIGRRAQDVETARKETERIKPLIAKAEKGDADAILEVGRYYCLVRGNYDKGLPLLAKSKDARLKGLAEKDLARPKDVRKQVDLADEWNELAKDEKGLTQRQAQRRALFWYRMVLPELTGGLVLARVRQEVDRLSALFPDVVIPTTFVEITGEIRSLANAHIGGAHAVAISKDGKLALTGGQNDNRVKLWNLDNGSMIREFTGHTGTIWGVALSPDGKYGVSASSDNTVRLWDLKTGNEIRRFAGLTDWGRAVYFLDNKRIVTASDDRTIRSWDVETGKQLNQIFQGHQQYINSMSINKDGTRAVTAGDDTLVCVWDLNKFTRIAQMKHDQRVWASALSPDGKIAVTSSFDGTVRVWDAESGKELRRLEHKGMVWALCFTPDGRRVLTGSGGMFQFGGKGEVVPGGDNALRLFDVHTGKEIRKLDGHTNYLRSIAASQDGRFVITASTDNTIRIWGKAK